jgi:hypothetical protein
MLLVSWWMFMAMFLILSSTRFDEGIKQPKFDKGSEIYPKLLH